MLVITMEVYDVSPGMELAVKEDLAMAIERRYGKTVRVISVEGKGEHDSKYKRISEASETV